MAVEKSQGKGGPLPIHLPKGRNFEKDSGEKKSSWLSSITMVFGVIFSICLAKLYIDQYIQIRALGKHRNRSEQELASTKAEYDRISEEVEYLETLEGVERLARDKLRYIRPDEVILVPLRPETD